MPYRLKILAGMPAALAVLAAAVGLQLPLSASGGKKPGPSLEACADCHPRVVQLAGSAGLAHGSRLTCLDCHEGHPPEQREIIPSCSRCHRGSAHFRLESCSSCHRNSHSPRRVSFPGGATVPCLTCHSAIGQEMAQFPSRHASEPCTDCHRTHKSLPGCLECHRPHSREMTQDDCRTCHRAHRPNVIKYDGAVPSGRCSACHFQAAEFLAASKTLHGNLRCVSCHRSEHRRIPACTECHPPHPAQSTGEGGCGVCHQAHGPVPVLPLRFDPATPSERCGFCHGESLQILRAGKTLHRDLECVDCHQGDHGTIVRCDDCHGIPHPQEILARFAGCNDCHGTAHALVK